MTDPTWAIPADRFRQRRRPGRADGVASSKPDVDGRARSTHVVWDDSAVDLDRIRPSDPDRARARFRAELPELIWNDAALEGNTYTLPEVRTLLDGVTVGGKRVEDEQQLIALSEAYSELDSLVATGAFRLEKATSDRLHAMVARHEARDAGRFRGEGGVTGGGHVRLSDGSRVEGVDAGDGGELLRERMDDLLTYLAELHDDRLVALVYFASATRTQFYFDGNKRTARLMMSGYLMVHGYDAVSVPAARTLEFNQALDTLFRDDDATTLLAFLATCTID